MFARREALLCLTPLHDTAAALFLRLVPRQHRPSQAELQQQQQAAARAEEQRQQDLAAQRRRRAPSRAAAYSLLNDGEEEVFFENADQDGGSSSSAAGPSSSSASRTRPPPRSHKENVARRELAFRAADQQDIATAVACAEAQAAFREEEQRLLAGLVQQRINEYACSARPPHPCCGDGSVTVKVC